MPSVLNTVILSHNTLVKAIISWDSVLQGTPEICLCMCLQLEWSLLYYFRVLL